MTFDRPQRIVHPTPPGALLKRFDAPVRARKQEAERDPAYLALVRQCPCLKCGMDPAGEAAHVRLSSASHAKSNAMAKRPADRYALSLCADCHRLSRVAQHQGSERAFWIALGIPPLYTCGTLYAQRGDLVAMRAVVIKTISERETFE